ncbi:MAG: hypothetical protein OXC55_07295 [Chloroflexi bacterium]|nr:hypothetical protein [Chloroflexota bacterium]
MKRKALIILSIAILAFAMIPALGAGAAAGTVKIVTPDELANPSGSTGSLFDKLDSADFVSDKTGTAANNLQDAGGTLFVIIEDNDATANPLTNYVAYFDAPALGGAQGGEVFDLTRANPAISTSTEVNQISDSDANVYVDTNMNIALPADIKFGDRNRDGRLDHEDITVSIGTFAAATAAEDDQSTPNVDESKVGFSSPSNLPSSVFIRFADDNTQVFLNTQIISTGSDVRISFASAEPNTLEFTTGANAGQSRVQVTSTSGDPIRVPVSEKALNVLDNPTDGVNHDALTDADAVSRDSGVFVGMFGVIRNDFKDAGSDWKPVPTDSAQSEEITATGTTVSTMITLPGVDNDNVLKGDVAVTIKDPERDNAGDAADPDAADPAVADAIEVSTVVAGNPDSTGAVAVTVTTNVPTVVADIFVLSYTTTALNDNVSDLIAAVEATTIDTRSSDESGPFAEFCDSSETDKDKQCAEADALVAALEAHRDNLGIDNDANASALLGMIIGVEHGDTVTARYSDASPRSTRSRSAEVDTVAPTIGGVNPANGSYLDDDDFVILFDVTDQDSGIPDEAHDPGEATIRGGNAYVQQTVDVGIGVPADGAPEETPDFDRDSEISDGERYELDIDVSAEAEEAEGDDDTDPVTVRVKVTINAYDIARNKAKTVTVNYIIDTIDPVLERAITGWAVKSRDDDHVLIEGQRNSIVLVFDDTIKGNEVRAQDISVVGNSVTNITWLNNSGSNKISVGNTGDGAGAASDLDFNAKTTTSGSAADVVDDLDLSSETNNQDARHLLFLTLESDLSTNARPNIEIDGDDLADLANNTNRSDHQARPADRLAPVFTVDVANALSNDAFDATLTASEALDRTPRASLVRMVGGDTDELRRTLTVRSGSGNTWDVSSDRKGLGLTASNGSQDGVFELELIGTDDNGNRVTSTQGKWELDTRANDGAAPARVGADSDKAVTQKIETNEVTFLGLEFSNEAGEYHGDTQKKITVDSMSLETLAASAIGSNNKIVASPTIEGTADVDAASAQSSDGIKHVIALSDLALGNYRLNVGFSDAAGNTGKFGYVFTITAPAPVKVDVVPGWSLVSIPGTPQDKSIEGVFAGSAVTDVWSLNNETKVWEFASKDEAGAWMGTLTQIVDGRGYFVRSTTFDPIKVLTERFSPQRTPPQYTVTGGWNSIGYTPAGSENSVSVDAYLSALGATGWGMIRTWNADATPPQYETYFSSGTATDGFPEADGVAIVESGKGYLLFATRNGVIGG